MGISGLTSFPRMKGLLIGSVLSFGIFYDNENTRSFLTTDISAILSIIGLISGGAISGFVVENYIIYKRILKTHWMSANKVGSILGAISGAVLSLPMAMVFGMGMGIALVLRFIDNLSAEILVPIGVSVGMPIVVLIVYGASFLAATLGFFAEQIIKDITNKYRG